MSEHSLSEANSPGVALRPPRLQFIRTVWFQIFAGGAVLFFGSDQALRITGQPGFVTTTILLGAFLVPAAFVAYFHRREQTLDRGTHPEMPLPLLLACFLAGGAIGVIVAGLVEYATLGSLSTPGHFGVGLIEETAKLILPLAIFTLTRYRSENDGLLFGVASGMGFAALETMGYGLVAILNSNGDTGALQEVLLIRGLLSPAGHAAWTGIVCAALWRQREETGHALSPGVVAVFVLAVTLHAFWDIFGSSGSAVLAYTGFALIGLISLSLLIMRAKEAKEPARSADPVST